MEIRTPHNIQRATPQNKDCASCHNNESLFLGEADVLPVFQTGNHLTIPISGTGSAGMETSLVNLLEPGDVAVICVHGVDHTAPVNMIYALREAPRIVAEEGLEARFARHNLNMSVLVAGIQAMGLEPLVSLGYRLPSLISVKIPPGIQDAEVRGRLLNQFGIEVGGGLGQLKGKIWRVGLMGHTSARRNVVLFLGALEDVLSSLGFPVLRGEALAAACSVYSQAEGAA